MRFLLIILTIYTLGTCNKANAQYLEPYFINIAEELPTQEVYDIFQDTLGYLWFATEVGILKYDGENFQKLYIDQRSESKSVFSFFKEIDTKIWINTEENRLYHFNPYHFDSTISAYKNNDKLNKVFRELITRNTIYINQVFHHKNGLYITISSETGTIFFDKDDQVSVFNFNPSLEEKKSKDLHISVDPEIIWTYLKDSKESSKGLYLTKGSKSLLVEKDVKYNYPQPQAVSDYLHLASCSFITIDKHVIKLLKDSLIKTHLPASTLCIEKHGDEIYVGTLFGLYVLDENLTIKAHYFKDRIISSILSDKDSNMWIGTVGNGIFFTQNNKVKKIIDSDAVLPSSIALSNGYFIVENNQSELRIYSQNGKLKKIFLNAHEHNGTYTCLEDLSSYLGKGTPIKVDKTYYLHVLPQKKSVKFMGRDKYYRYQIDEFISPKYNIIDAPYVNDIAFYEDSSLLISTIDGLFKKNLPFGLDTSKLHDIHLDESQLLTSTSSTNFEEIVDFKYGKLIICSKGLAIYRYKDENVNYISPKDINNFAYINDIYVEHDTIAWLGTNNGIVKVVFKENGHTKYSDLLISEELSSKHVISMSSDDKNYWIGTRKGIHLAEKATFEKKLSKIKSKHFIIDSIKVKDRIIDSSDSLNINYDDNLEFFFKFISFNTNRVEFQLDSDDWLNVNSNNIRLGTLVPGWHSLKFKVSQLDESEIVSTYHIFVAKPFTHEWWFISLVILSISFFIFLMTKLYFTYVNKKQSREHEKLRLELKVLTTQMNPHFMFNTINSIQHSILKKNKVEAMDQLSNFAQLVRKTLDFSINERITIEEEINFLKLYVGLENGRFDIDFKLDFKIDTTIDVENDLIPTLLIQPIVENIFVHAQYADEQEKVITIKLKFDQEFYIIEVIDYGIGRASKQLYKSHQSHGLSIVRKRIKLYNGSLYQPEHLNSSFTDPISKAGQTVAIKLRKWKQ